jgi:hypothetical protein
MSKTAEGRHRVIVIHDNPPIHPEFRKLLQPTTAPVDRGI